MDVTELVGALRGARYRVGSEALLQHDIGETLKSLVGISGYEAEARIGPGDRIDFLVGTIGIEAKVKYPRRKIWRQLDRYTGREAITSLILITGTAIGLPAAMNGKPLYLVSLGRASL